MLKQYNTCFSVCLFISGCGNNKPVLSTQSTSLSEWDNVLRENTNLMSFVGKCIEKLNIDQVCTAVS